MSVPEYEMTGVLSSIDITERGQYKVANISLKRGGKYSKQENKYMANFYPIECWLDDHIKILKECSKGDVISVRFQPFPRQLKTSDFNRTIIVFKASKIIPWNQKKEQKNEYQQISMDTQMFEG